MNRDNETVLTEVAQAIFERLFAAGEATRKVLAEATGFSFPSVTVALAELAAKDMVCELRREQGARGRATIIYGVSDAAGWVLGVDIGSTQISYVCRSLNGRYLGGNTLKRDNSHASVGELAGTFVARAPEINTLNSAPLAVTVSINQVVPRQLLDPHRPRSLALDIAETFAAHCSLPAGIPFIVENNVNCAAVTEHIHGLMSGYDDAAYMQIGVGIGMGFFSDGALIRGGHGYSGELAQIPLSWNHLQPSEPDALEALYGSKGLMRRAAAMTDDESGAQADSPQTLFALGAAGHEKMHQLMREYSVALGRIAATAATILDPAILVLGGGLSRDPMFSGLIMEEFKSRNAYTQIALSQRGPDATVEGACLLATDLAMTRIASRFYKPICARPTMLPE